MFCLLLTAEPIWVSFTVKLLVGPGKVYNYFWGEETSNLQREIDSRNFLFTFSFLFNCRKLEFILPPFPQEASRGVASSNEDKVASCVCIIRSPKRIEQYLFWGIYLHTQKRT